MSIFESAKNLAAGVALRVYLNGQLGSIGSLSSVDIDRNQKRIKCTLILAGEASPLDITVDGWTFGGVDQPSRIRVIEIITSRLWLTAICNRTIVGKWFDVPAEHLSKIKLALGS